MSANHVSARPMERTAKIRLYRQEGYAYHTGMTTTSFEVFNRVRKRSENMAIITCVQMKFYLVYGCFVVRTRLLQHA